MKIAHREAAQPLGVGTIFDGLLVVVRPGGLADLTSVSIGLLIVTNNPWNDIYSNYELNQKKHQEKNQNHQNINDVAYVNSPKGRCNPMVGLTNNSSTSASFCQLYEYNK